MKAIYKRELRAYLTSMTGYIFMAVLLAVTGLYYTANCIIGGYPVFAVVMSSVYFILMLLVPVLTMRSLSEERKQKTDQLLLTGPVSVVGIVAGKYLAMLTVFLIPMAVICLYPLILLLFGSVSLPMAYTAILGYILLGAACLAIGLFLSSLTESQVIAAVMTFGVLFFANMASGIASLISLDGILGGVLQAVCLQDRFINFIQGIFDGTAVIYYLSIVLLFLYLTVWHLQKRRGKYRIGLAAAACVAAVAVNFLTAQLPSGFMKYDASQQKLFTTGEQTAGILKDLGEDVTLYLIAREGGEDSTLMELLAQYESLSGHISVETKDPAQYPGFLSQYTDEEAEDNSILVVGEKRSKLIDYYDIYQYDIDYNTFSSSLSAFDGEGQITSAIDYVTSSEVPVLYTLEGHGEAELYETLVSSIEKENIEIRSLNLLSSGAVPKEAGVLLINAPLSDISGEEKEKLQDYMQSGGSVVLLAGYTETARPNLEELIGDYGLELAEGLVLEGSSEHRLPNYPYYLLPDIGSSELTKDVTGRYVLTAFARGIRQKEDVNESLDIMSLLTTSDQSYAKKDIRSEIAAKEEGDPDGPFDVGVLVTDTRTGGRLVYFSTETLLDVQADSMVSGANTMLFMGVISSLIGHEDTVSIAAKNLSVEYLTVTAGSALFWGLLLVVVLPLALLAGGGAVWFQRRKR